MTYLSLWLLTITPSNNLIYCIPVLVGKIQTGDYIRKLVTVHKQQINHPELSQTHTSRHLATCAKGCDLQCHIIPFV